MTSNYPPGVTGNEPQIAGDEAWEDVHEAIDEDAVLEGMSAIDVQVAWSFGLAMWRAGDLP